MDTHFSTHPDIEPIPPGFGARLPGEGETSPETGELETGERLASSSLKSLRGQRRALLAGVAVAAIVIAGGVFLEYEVSHQQASVNSAAQNAAHSAQSTLRPILAPSASLAKVSVPPAPPATRNTWFPQPRDREVAELLSLHQGSTDKLHAAPVAGSRIEGQAAGAAGHPTTTPTAHDGGLPAGYVPREPGSSAGSLAPDLTSPLPKPPVTAAAGATGDATARIIASLTQAQPAVEDSPVAPQNAPALDQLAMKQATGSSAPTAAPSVTPLDPSQPDVLSVATNLRAGPMTTPEQVQVLNLVSEMAAVVKNMHKQQAQFRSDLAKSSMDVTARLADFERRVALAEARSGVAAADDLTGSAPTQASVEPASDHTATSLRLVQVMAMRPVAAVPSPPVPSAPKIYRVQAASPGLALLAQVDRGGGDGAQMQVVVGDTVPEYGRVKSIAQKGTAWVVTTEHGAIQ